VAKQSQVGVDISLVSIKLGKFLFIYTRQFPIARRQLNALETTIDLTLGAKSTFVKMIHHNKTLVTPVNCNNFQGIRWAILNTQAATAAATVIPE
jgi:hypothetical protein